MWSESLVKCFYLTATLNSFMDIAVAHFEIHIFVFPNYVLGRWGGNTATT